MSNIHATQNWVNEIISGLNGSEGNSFSGTVSSVSEIPSSNIKEGTIYFVEHGGTIEYVLEEPENIIEGSITTTSTNDTLSGFLSLDSNCDTPFTPGFTYRVLEKWYLIGNEDATDVGDTLIVADTPNYLSSAYAGGNGICNIILDLMDNNAVWIDGALVISSDTKVDFNVSLIKTATSIPDESLIIFANNKWNILNQTKRKKEAILVTNRMKGSAPRWPVSECDYFCTLLNDEKVLQAAIDEANSLGIPCILDEGLYMPTSSLNFSGKIIGTIANVSDKGTVIEFSQDNISLSNCSIENITILTPGQNTFLGPEVEASDCVFNNVVFTGNDSQGVVSEGLKGVKNTKFIECSFNDLTLDDNCNNILFDSCIMTIIQLSNADEITLQGCYATDIQSSINSTGKIVLKDNSFQYVSLNNSDGTIFMSGNKIESNASHNNNDLISIIPENEDPGVNSELQTGRVLLVYEE